MPRNKEEIYDEDIHPLIAQVIKTCKDNGIGLFFHANIPTEADSSLCCTTSIPSNANDLSKPGSDPAGDQIIERLRRFVYSDGRRSTSAPESSGPVVHIEQTNSDGSKVITAILP